MKKISKESIAIIKKYVLSEMNNVQITSNNIDELLEILSSKISGLVTDIEDNNNDSKENYDLLRQFDSAFDEINESEELDYDYLNYYLNK